MQLELVREIKNTISDRKIKKNYFYCLYTYYIDADFVVNSNYFLRKTNIFLLNSNN